jgi:two-component system, OmpR family, sensor histidine kinase KdpD
MNVNMSGREDQYYRPNPDELLAHINKEEARTYRGKLKIFLGYAAGVGKTYAMLESAQRLKKDIDIVIAYAETHGRNETEALLDGLEIVPRKKLEYRGVTLSEMDIDAVLTRHPKIALMDELAHTNAPGSRHPKRYMDMEELLEAGIDVFATLNIQHLESLRDSVARITGVWVRETIPDSVIDKADEIELVDLPPDDLLQRLREGKVYISEQIAQAVTNFFRKGNLSALREFSMRTAADHIEGEVNDYMKSHTISGPWPIAEHLLVCISPRRLGDRIIRAARNLSSQLNASWTAIYVATPGTSLSSEEQERLTRLMTLAEKLGAKTEILQGLSVAGSILEYANQHNITKIVLGKPERVRLRNILSSSVANQIVRGSKFIDIYIVGGKGQSLEQTILPQKKPEIPWRGYIISLGMVFLATVFGYVIHPFVEPVNALMLYLLSVVISAVYFGLGPSIITSVCGLLAFDFFLVPPYFSLRVSDVQYLFTFIALLSVGIIISYLASRMRRQSELALGREKETSTLYSLNKDLSSTININETMKSITEIAGDQFGQHALVFLPDSQNANNLKPFSASKEPIFDENDIAVAAWTFEHQKPAGRNTDTLPDTKALYLPLSTVHGRVGVLALSPIESEFHFATQQDRLLNAFADLAAMSIERVQLSAAANTAQILDASHKLQTALLNSISHDLRTPLVSIIGVLSSLQEGGIDLDDTAKNNLVQVASEESARLNRLITNLLDVSKIEAGALKLSVQPSDMQEIIGAAMEQISSRYKDRDIKIQIPSDLPLIPLDSGLMVQVMFNILENAIKYSDPQAPIQVVVKFIDQNMKIEIYDRGIGIPTQDLARVFDKFYRVQRPDNITGTGLGLSICKGIVEAHGGTIVAENRSGGGTVIIVNLPLSRKTAGV